MHAVFNRQPCIKVAVEYMEAGRAALYPTVGRLIAEHFGDAAVLDYMPIYTCAFNHAILH